MPIGIDPGYKGAIVQLDENKKFVSSYPMPIVEHEGRKTLDVCKLFTVFSEMRNDWGESLVFMEEIWTNKPLIKQVGIIEGILVTLGYELVYVKPKAWQMYAFNKTNRGNKKLSLAWCRHRYPDLEFKNDGKSWPDLADAIIIANCGIQAYNVLGKEKIQGLITQRLLGYG